jgi:hypothetical protein
MNARRLLAAADDVCVKKSLSRTSVEFRRVREFEACAANKKSGCAAAGFC